MKLTRCLLFAGFTAAWLWTAPVAEQSAAAPGFTAARDTARPVNDDARRADDSLRAEHQLTTPRPLAAYSDAVLLNAEFNHADLARLAAGERRRAAPGRRRHLADRRGRRLDKQRTAPAHRRRGRRLARRVHRKRQRIPRHPGVAARRAHGARHAVRNPRAGPGAAQPAHAARRQRRPSCAGGLIAPPADRAGAAGARCGTRLLSS